ncbi:MAG TPA: AraC family transcriptional regulator [Burkholderiaceae bacterium]|nr:AraC family transcriptional regulator [Burkholderiaceae bacterium]
MAKADVFATPWPGIHATRIDSARHYPRHSHATYGFGVIERGAQRSASGRGQVDAHAGDLITHNPGEVHDGKPIGDGGRLWRMLHLVPAMFAAALGDADGDQASLEIALTRPVIQDRALRHAVQSLLARIDEWNAAGALRAGDALACDEALARVGALLRQRHSTQAHSSAHAATAGSDGPPAALERVRELLADRLLDPPSLAALAELAGIGKFQLLRRFGKAYGMPPHAWLIQQRAERVRSLVQAGVPLGTAALDAGFSDQSHMTRVFVRQFGFTPGAWQRAARRGLLQ